MFHTHLQFHRQCFQIHFSLGNVAVQEGWEDHLQIRNTGRITTHTYCTQKHTHYMHGVDARIRTHTHTHNLTHILTHTHTLTQILTHTCTLAGQTKKS